MQEDDTQDIICDELWFEDGTVVIVASVDNRRHLCKVHKSVLSTHSPIFRDLFVLPQPPAGDQSKDSDTYGGLPLVDFKDAPEDVRDLLVALYYPTRLVCRRIRRTTYKKVAGVLRLSTKYEITELSRHIKGVLDADWPSNFDAWEANELVMNDMIHHASTGAYARAYKLPSSVETIQLARECGITSVLPAAFYNIARVMEDPAPIDLGNVGYRGCEKNQCTSDDLLRVISGRESLRRHAWDIYRSNIPNPGEPPFDGCEDYYKCQYYLKEWWIASAGEYLFTMEDLLGTLRVIISEIDGLPKVCHACGEKMRKRIRKDREEVWNRLPIYFALENTSKVPNADPMDSDSDEASG